MRIAGHLQDYRALGGVAFALVRDGSGIAQVTLKKETTDPALFAFFASTPRESVIQVDGLVQTSPKAQRGMELIPTQAELLSLAQVPLPLGVVDKVGAELDTRLNHRVMDLRKPAVRAIFELRTALLEGLRQAFLSRGFLEVETPKILRQGAEGGATMFAVDYFDSPAFLAQSPQLYKQMLMSAGFERVFEIAPAFRAEPSDTVRHLTEFTSVDGEVAYIRDGDDVRQVLEAALADTLATARTRLESMGNPFAEKLPVARPPFPRIPFAECEQLLERPGAEQDLATEDEKRLGEILVEKYGNPFYFLTDFPAATKTHTFYAHRYDDRPNLVDYFDLDYRGMELASGGRREHRLDRLTANIRVAGLDPATLEGYLEAFRFGMPPHGGWGFGLDRFVTVLAELPNIREARLFPRDRYRLTP
ncbi:MAG: aspartate--tRNA(Asn) ligase [Thermoplasmata archaeon]|nr:aspartate--tRNA(Asn) ligase [Thermoplasmata archaeon]